MGLSNSESLYYLVFLNNHDVGRFYQENSAYQLVVDLFPIVLPRRRRNFFNAFDAFLDFLFQILRR